MDAILHTIKRTHKKCCNTGSRKIDISKKNELLFEVTDNSKILYSKIGRQDNYLAAFFEGLNYCEIMWFFPAPHIDPVLLYDFPEVDNISVPMDNYMVVYACEDRIKGKKAEAIREFAKRENKKILSLGFYQPFCDEYVLASPLKVLATDTIHGTVFSIKYQKKFGSIIRESNRQ